jgi:hypothetical protein
VAKRVFLHIGLPKTGTTFVQSVLWAHRESLAASGLLLPGAQRRDHLWASCVVRGEPNVERRHPLAASSWERLLQATREWPADVIITHEFFCAASAEQARDVAASLSAEERHLVITARDTLELFTSSWQEALKDKSTTPIEAYCASASDDPTVVWDWRALDLGLVLARWLPAFSPEKVHVVAMPRPPAGPEVLWRRFAGVLGVDPESVDLSVAHPNRSLGVVEAETLRRLNSLLTDFDKPFARGVWIRTFLADERLVPREGEPFWPSPDVVEDCRRRGSEALDLVHLRGLDFRGSPDDLLTPPDIPERRHPSSVEDAEVAQVALELAAQLLGDARRLAGELRRSAAAQTAPLSIRASAQALTLALRAGVGRRLANARTAVKRRGRL